MPKHPDPKVRTGGLVIGSLPTPRPLDDELLARIAKENQITVESLRAKAEELRPHVCIDVAPPGTYPGYGEREASAAVDRTLLEIAADCLRSSKFAPP
jgi:hypothetical protein